VLVDYCNWRRAAIDGLTVAAEGAGDGGVLWGGGDVWVADKGEDIWEGKKKGDKNG